MKMKSMFLVMVLAAIVAVQPLTAQNVDKRPFCTTCEVENLNADVYIVIPDDITGQLISGQFRRITYLEGKNDAPIAMSLEEIAAFVEGDGFNHLKENGDVYFTLLLDNKYFLVEVEKLGGSYGPLKIQSYDKTIREHLNPFLQVIIPRPKKQNT